MQQKDCSHQTESDKLANARTGYQGAITIWIGEAEILWGKFNALLVANSIILGAVFLLCLNESQSGLGLVSVVMCAVGISLCVLWFLLTHRSFEEYRYWIYSARELEEQFLSNPVQTVSRGGRFATGKQICMTINGKPHERQMHCLARCYTVRWICNLIILLFVSIYILTIGFLLIRWLVPFRFCAA